MDDTHDKHVAAHAEMLRAIERMPRRDPDMPPWLVALACILAALVLLGTWKLLELMGGK